MRAAEFNVIKLNQGTKLIVLVYDPAPQKSPDFITAFDCDITMDTT